MERTVYLSNTDIETAIKEYLEIIRPAAELVNIETIDVRTALGRVTASPVFARISAPNHNAAAMDGIMVQAEKTYRASETDPVDLIQGADFEYINTGHLMKEPYDAVIMVEDLIDLEAGRVRVTLQASPWQHVRPIGEDIVAGEMVLPGNHSMRPIDIGAVLNSGVTEIEVFERVRVGIMPTGNEIKDRYDQLEPGETFDTNSWTFQGIIQEWGGSPQRISPVPDDYRTLKEALLELVKSNHVVVINAGSSAGSMDYTATLIGELGQVVFHGLGIRPGKPTILGVVQGKPVIGVPGYPGSAFLAFEEIVGPVFRLLQRTQIQTLPVVDAVVSRRIVSSLKYREYIRVKVGKVGDKRIATPLPRGAGVTMSLVKADGLLIIPKNSEGFEAGETVPVHLTKDMRAIERTIVSIGSHDLIMDYIASLMEETEEKAGITGYHLSSAHVGSMGGILALSRGEAHIAPIHLLDETTGEYNTSYLEKYLKNQDVVLVKGVKRQQGFIVKEGNPKDILSIEDLCRSDVSFVNRQRGSGTRLLTDHLLQKSKIDSNGIRGYDRDMTTHMAVAAAVNGGSADVGIGVYSAAKAMGLDFINIGYEEYDFAIPRIHMESEMIQAFLAVLHSQRFKEILKELGGYEPTV